jgi:hypothetical protein
MGKLAQKALQTIREQGGRVIDYDLIDRTLREIGEGYRPRLLAWIRTDRERWKRLLDLEDKINRATLAGDGVTLTDALSEYRRFFEKMLIEYGKGETLPLSPRTG